MHDHKVSKWPGPQLPPPEANRFECVLQMAMQRRVTENQNNEQHRRRVYGDFKTTATAWEDSYD